MCIHVDHWTDNRRIHTLMTHLGKTGKTGKLTRRAFVADQVGQKMIKIDPHLGELWLSVKKKMDFLWSLIGIKTLSKT